MKIKTWFLSKNFTSNERMIIEMAIFSDDVEILKETEKAVFVQFTSDYGAIKTWMPKSCMLNDDEPCATTGLDYNIMLVNFAKSNGIKGIRTGLKTETLINKIRRAGLQVPARA